MKIKSLSLLVKLLLITLGFGLCVLKWMGILPNATINEIWYSVGFAYGVGLGSVDFNIIRDNWIEKREERDE